MNICLCGAQAGYPHAADCPYPLYRDTLSEGKGWLVARTMLQAELAELQEQDERRRLEDEAAHR